MHQPRAAQPISPWREVLRGRLGVYTLLINLGILFFGVDNFLINILMPAIIADIGGVAFYAWAMMLYLVGAISGAASYGPLRARIGGRLSLTTAGAVFSLGALGCALAPAIGVLLMSRLVQGFGGGLIIAGSMAFVSALFEPRLRKQAVAITNVTWIISAVVGPAQAGIFGTLGWWRGAFFLYVPIGAAYLIGILWRIPKDTDPPSPGRQTLRFPVWRVALLGLGVACVGSAGQMQSAVLRAVFLAAAVVMVWQAFARDARADNRLFPSAPLSLSAPVGLNYWGHILMSSAYIAVSIYLPLALTVLHGISPLYVGIANGSMSIGWSLAAAAVAGLSGPRERMVVTAGPLCLMAGSVGLAIATLIHAPFLLFMLLAVMVGIGIGIFHVHMTVRVMAAARPGEESITASSLSTIRTLGMAFGAAVAGTVANLAGLAAGASEEAVRGAVVGVYLFNALPLLFALIVVSRFFARSEPALRAGG
jgi:MFS family permease